MSVDVSEMKWTELSVADAIESSRHADKSAWVCVRSVPNATSLNKSRTADLMAMGCWKSVEIALHGYEIKVSRSDWLREIQDPSKAAAFSKHCHYWWIAAPKGIVKIEELPATWGLVEVWNRGDGSPTSKVRKAVSRNDLALVDFDFFAACMRQCRKTDPIENKIQKRLREEYRRGFEIGSKRNSQDSRVDALQAAYDKKVRVIDEFERASGIKIETWGQVPAGIGAAVRHVLKFGSSSIVDCGSLLNQLDEMKETIRSFQAACAIKDMESK